MKKVLVFALITLAAGFWYYKSGRPLPGTSPAPWEEVSVADFDAQVLQSPLPVLVYFDAVEGCDGADVVFVRLRKQWGKQLRVFHFKAESNPDFARRYGVEENVVFALFRDGRMVKRIDAPTLLKPLMGPDNTVASFDAFLDDFLAAIERFANLR